MDKDFVKETIEYTIAVIIVLILFLVFNFVITGILYFTLRFWSQSQAVMIFKGGNITLLTVEALICVGSVIHSILHKDKGDE